MACSEEGPREPYEWDAVEIGMQLGHIAQLSKQTSRRKKRGPIGFGGGVPLPRKPRGQRRPGTWPDVPHFDIREES